MTDQTTEDALLDGRVRVTQPATGYRAAIDPVLLAAALPVRLGAHVLDAGSGVGTAGLCLAARVPDCRIVLLERQPDLARLAQANIAANGFSERMEAVCGDLAAPPPGTQATFDAVMTNPPFAAAGSGTAPPDPSKAQAHVEDGIDLAGWIDLCARRLKTGGWLAVIHRADRIDSLIAALGGRFGAITILPLWPKQGHPAKRVVILARKGSKTPATLAPGLILHEEDGRFTAEALAILRGGGPLKNG